MPPPRSSGRHHCLLFGRAQELDSVLGPFVEEGVRLGWKVLLVGSESSPEAYRAMAQHARADLGRSDRAGQVSFRTVTECFFAGSGFDRYKAISFVRDQIRLARDEGFHGLRLVQDLESLKQGPTGVRDVIAFEAGLGVVLKGEPCVVLCLYDRRTTSPSLVLGCLDLHPTLLVGGDLTEQLNPFYQPAADPTGSHRANEIAEERLRVLSQLRAIDGGTARAAGESLFRRVIQRTEDGATSLERVLRGAVEELGERMNARAGRAHLVDRGGDLLVSSGAWRLRAESGVWEAASEEEGHALTRGQGLAGRAWLARRPVWTADVREDPHVAGALPTLPVELRAGVAVPLVGSGSVFAVLELFLSELSEPDEELLAQLEPVARILGEVVARLRVQEQLLEARATLDTLVGGSSEGVIVTDEAGRIRSWNRKAAALLGQGGTEVPVGRPVEDLVQPELRERLRRALEITALGEERGLLGGSVELQFPRMADGSTPVRVTVTSAEVRGEPSSLLILTEVTGALPIVGAERTERILPDEDAGPLLITSGDLRWGGSAIVHASRAFCRMTGYTEPELLGRSLRLFAGPKTERQVFDRIHEQFASGEPFSTEFVAYRKSGDPFLLRLDILAVRNYGGKVTHFMAMHPDPVRDEAVADALKRAETDPLTGLANRFLFDKMLRRAIERTRKSPELHFGVLFLDLDRFKDVNDTYGHVMGDELLSAVALQLEGAVRPGDVVARFGGDEFVILLDIIGGLKEVLAVAGRVKERLDEPIEIQGESLRVSASIGIALSETGYATVEEVLSDADSAMYHAKREQRGGVRIFDPALQKAVAAADRIRSALESSLERGDFRLYYQPLVDLVSNRITGLEALLRWNHPERGMVPAGEFIDQAEDMGLILPIGRWVIREACGQLAAWRQQMRSEFDVVVSVNLSSRELLDAGLPAWIRRSLEETGVPPSSLRVEIPESFLAHTRSDVDRVLQSLRDLGIGIGIGDFGGRYSSLSHLRRSPVDLLKMDRQFVADLPEPDIGGGVEANERDVRSILALAKSLGMKVVAAGVETPRQRELLLRLSCSFGQGYLFSAPVEAAGARDLLRTAWNGDTGSELHEA